VDTVTTGTDDLNEVVRAYAALTSFRAATAEELVNAENPFRRPVRPDDLGFLDYGKPIGSEPVQGLRALLGHRMLRNIHDADRALLLPPGGPGSAAWADAEHFYSAANLARGRAAAPILRRCLFAFLEDTAALAEAGERPPSPFDADRVAAAYERARELGAQVTAAVAASADPESATRFVLLQTSITRAVAPDAAARLLPGDYDDVHPTLHPFLADVAERGRQAADTLRRTFAAAGLSPAPTAYWQFLLGSSLALGNFASYLGDSRADVAPLLGALAWWEIEEAATGTTRAALFHRAWGTPEQVPGAEPKALAQRIDAVLAPLVARHGTLARAGFDRGFAQARRLAELWTVDLVTQVTWADRIDEHMVLAEKLSAHIDRERIEVDLDTFVETAEETSTTHVHDDHRLVIIESGKMHFWNNAGHRIALSTGDKLLIPAHRLHGSVVLSGVCTYHQPIIPDSMLAEIRGQS
jgi:hypothetical protein